MIQYSNMLLDILSDMLSDERLSLSLFSNDVNINATDVDQIQDILKMELS